MKNDWSIKSWNELTKDEFHNIIQLREAVFVVEQNCSYLDVDGKDLLSHHLFLYDNDTVIAYTRLIPKGISYEKSSSIGRVVVSPDYRGKKIAREMMEIAIKETLALFEENTIIISAQSYLEQFYSSLGFQTTGEEYLEDDLPHIKMVYTKN